MISFKNLKNMIFGKIGKKEVNEETLKITEDLLKEIYGEEELMRLYKIYKGPDKKGFEKI